MEAVTSGVAFVSIAFKLTDACVKLYNFWESIEDAPQEIATIKEDLHYLSSVFTGIACNAKTLGDSVVEGIRHCEIKVAELTSIVEKFDMSNSSRRKRVWAAFKATAHTKQLQRFRESLSETKATLTLAMIHQCILQPPLYTISTVGSNMLQSPQLRGPENHAQIEPCKSVIENPNVLTYYQQHIPSTSLITSNFQTLMHDAIGQTALTKFTPNSLEIFAEDGYTVNNAGIIQAKTFVYGNYISYRTQHHTSSFRTALGCILVRTTTINITNSNNTDGEREQQQPRPRSVTSIIFYPTAWVQRVGLKSGLEALMAAGCRSWLFNCRITVTCAVPEDALIFEMCRKGQTKAVESLLSRGLGSVVDTSPRGWKPLHFAAAGGHVDLCALLIREGAEKTALVYDGPAPSILSPISIFVASAETTHADTKIAMLRLFSDCIDISAPTDDGWSVHEWLKRAYAKERVPISQNSITWLLHLTAKEEYVEFGSRTVWCALQHAMRSVFAHEFESRFFLRILQLSDRGTRALSDSKIQALGKWIALRVSGREILPMVLQAGSALQMRGFDWEQDDVPHAQLVKSLPEVYGAWCRVLLETVERLEEYMISEFGHCLSALGWKFESLLWGISDTAGSRWYGQVCSGCGDDYGALGSGLVEPARIAKEECIDTNHKFSCVCQTLNDSRAGLPVYSRSSYYSYLDPDSDSDSDSDFFDAEEFWDAEQYLGTDTDNVTQSSDFFSAIALQLFRSHGRVWIGEYFLGEQLCATCFLCREQYVSADGLGDFPSMPKSFEGLRVAR